MIAIIFPTDWSVYFLINFFSAESTSEKIAQGEKQLGDQIRAILKHYQQDDPVGLPGAPVPDPMPVPDMKHSFSVYTMTFKEIQVYGLSKFRIENIKSELALMQVGTKSKILIPRENKISYRQIYFLNI